MSYLSNTPDHSRPGDAEARIKITRDFQRFTQHNDVFSRANWDDTVRSKHTDGFFNSFRMQATPRRGNGFSQRDFALRNATWLISDVMTAGFTPAASIPMICPRLTWACLTICLM